MKVTNLKQGNIYQCIINDDNYKEIYMFSINRVINDDYIVINNALLFKTTGEFICVDYKSGLTGTDDFDKRTLKEVKDQKIIEMFNEKIKKYGSI